MQRQSDPLTIFKRSSMQCFEEKMPSRLNSSSQGVASSDRYKKSPPASLDTKGALQLPGNELKRREPKPTAASRSHRRAPQSTLGTTLTTMGVAALALSAGRGALAFSQTPATGLKPLLEPLPNQPQWQPEPAMAIETTKASEQPVKPPSTMEKTKTRPFDLLLPGRMPAYSPPAPAAYRNVVPLMAGATPKATGAFYGTKVEFLNEKQREEYKVSVEDGLLYDAKGQLVDTQNSPAIYVMDAKGEIYLKVNPVDGKFIHSSFLAGEPVASAGEIRVEKGVIKLINNKSGHYRPTMEQTQQVVHRLKSLGVADFDVFNQKFANPFVQTLRNQEQRQMEATSNPSLMDTLRNASWLELTAFAGSSLLGGVMINRLFNAAARSATNHLMGRRNTRDWLKTLPPQELKLIRLVALERGVDRGSAAQAVLGLNDTEMAQICEKLEKNSPQHDALLQHVIETIPAQEKEALTLELTQHSQPANTAPTVLRQRHSQPSSTAQIA